MRGSWLGSSCGWFPSVQPESSFQQDSLGWLFCKNVNFIFKITTENNFYLG